MTSPDTQPADDLSSAIASAVEHCITHGLVASADTFFADFEDEERVSALVLSPNEYENAYGVILASLREQALLQAHALVESHQPRPVPAMADSSPLPPEVGGSGIQDGVFVEDPVEFVDAYNQPEGVTEVVAAGQVIPLPVPPVAVAAAPSDIGVESVTGPDLAPHDIAMAEKVSGLLGQLHATPVGSLRLVRTPAAGIASPFQITEEQRELVLAVIAPLMSAAGLVAVEIPPTYYDMTRGKDVELNLDDADDASIFLRAALRR